MNPNGEFAITANNADHARLTSEDVPRQVTVSFTPTAAPRRDATLSIPSNDPNDAGTGGARAVALRGTGIFPVASIVAIDAPKVLLVRKPHQAAAQRLLVTLRTDRVFDGTATLSASTADVALYAADAGGEAIQLPLANIAGGDLSGEQGVRWYLEARNPSVAVTLTLTLNGGSQPHGATGTDTVACVELTLDLYAPRRTQNAAPLVLAADAKIDPGRRLQQQTDAHEATRARLVVRKAAPPAYAGNLVLRRANDRVALRVQEIAAGGQATTAAPVTVANGDVGDAGAEHWVEGAGAGDSGFTLGLAALPDVEGDRVTVRVNAVGGVRFVRCISEPATEVDARDIGAPGNLSKMAKEVRLLCRRMNRDAPKSAVLPYNSGWDDGNDARACTMHVDGMTRLYADIGYIMEAPADSPRIHQYSWRDASAPTGLRPNDEILFLYDFLDAVRVLWWPRTGRRTARTTTPRPGRASAAATPPAECRPWRRSASA